MGRLYFIEAVAIAVLAVLLGLGYFAMCDVAGERMANVLAGLVILCVVMAFAFIHQLNAWDARQHGAKR